MIKSVTVTNYLGNSLVMELTNPEESGLAITSITGLGPAKATITTTDMVSSDGSIFNSARAQKRNIVLKVRMMDTPSVEENRQLTYKYFPIKKKLKFQVETDTKTVYTYGYVESNEPDIFSSAESASISIICPNSYWILDTSGETVFSGIEPLFSFPFGNTDDVRESVEVLPKRLGRKEVFHNTYFYRTEFEISRSLVETSGNVYYEGEAETGVLITMHFIGEAKNIKIYNSMTDEVMTINTDYIEEITGTGITNSDDIIIDTIHGEKSITLLREGVYTNIMNCLSRDSDWFQLAKGDNVFGFIAEEGVYNIQFKVDYDVLYEGI